MSGYNFHDLLDPYTYQQLVCSVLQIRENQCIEVYKEGKDQGIDGSYISDEGRVIIQAKRYQTDFTKLIRMLEKSELPKVKKLNPDRYILAVSMDFTPHQKEQIKALFEGYIKSTRDIITQTDINLLFDKPEYASVHEKYLKWLCPGDGGLNLLLKRIVNAEYYTEAAHELEAAHDQEKVFVPTRYYQKAIEGWEKKKVILITGVPGIGKTSMARVLALSYLRNDDVTGYVWARSTKDIDAHWDDAKKIVFVLDDFWGSILSKDSDVREEKRLVALIKKIAKDSEDRRLILTTREYILQQGYLSNREIQEALKRYAYICSMNEYEYDEKAAILYSHLYESDLDYDYVEYLYQRSKEIVYHENYDPRILALYIEDGADGKALFEYYDGLLEYFDTPTKYWDKVIKELSEEARFIAVLMLVSTAPIYHEDLDTCYKQYISMTDRGFFPKSIQECVGELENTILFSYFDEEREEVAYRFRLPVIEDYLFELITDNAQKYAQILIDACCYYNQLVYIYRHMAPLCLEKTVNQLSDRLIDGYIELRDTYDDFYILSAYVPNYETPHNDEVLCRISVLIDLYEIKKNEKLKAFIESCIQRFSLNEERAFEGKYYDMWSYPEIIVKMKKAGLNIPDDRIVRWYYDNLFSIQHIDAARSFETVYPQVYQVESTVFIKRIENELREFIYEEIENLFWNDMEPEVDILLDSIGEICRRFGWEYSKSFEKEVYEWADRDIPESEESQEAQNEEPKQSRYKNRDSFENIKEDGEWILGPYEEACSRQDINHRLSESTLSESVKEEINEQLNKRASYLHNVIQSKEELAYFVHSLEAASITALPKSESEFIRCSLLGVCREYNVDSGKVMRLLAHCLSLVVYTEEAVIRKHTINTDEYINKYLEDKSIKAVFEKWFILQDKQWIRLINLSAYAFSFVMFMMVYRIDTTEDEAKADNEYEELFGESDEQLRVFRNIPNECIMHRCYADYGVYPLKNDELKTALFRMYEEADSFEFNKRYVYPKALEFQRNINGNTLEQRVFEYLKYIDMYVSIDCDGRICGSRYSISDDLDVLESLSIVQIIDCGKKELSREILLCLNNAGHLKEDMIENRKEIRIIEIGDLELIEQITSCDTIRENIGKIDRICLRFDNGDFSYLQNSM